MTEPVKNSGKSDVAWNSRRVLSWTLYDWANSAFATVVMAGFFPVFFMQFWSAGVDVNTSTARLGLGNAVAGLLVALAAREGDRPTPRADLVREAGLPLTTLESGVPLKAVDIVGVSLLYELNFTNMLTMLDLAGIPFFSRDRDESHPLVIAGGPAMTNPPPWSALLDGVVIAVTGSLLGTSLLAGFSCS